MQLPIVLTDSIVLKDTTNRDPCAACKTAHTVEVLIFYTLSLSTSMVWADLHIAQCKEQRILILNLVTFSTMPSRCVACPPARCALDISKMIHHRPTTWLAPFLHGRSRSPIGML